MNDREEGRGEGRAEMDRGADKERVSSTLVPREVLARVIDKSMRMDVSLVEVFVEEKRVTSASLDDARIEELHSGRNRGAGVRVICGESTGFAHTSDISEAGLLAAATAAAATARGAADETRTVALDAAKHHDAPDGVTDPIDVAKEKKVELLWRANEAARAAGGEIRQVSASFADAQRRIQIANSDGLHESEMQVRSGFVVNCVGARDALLQNSFSTLRQTKGFELFATHDVEDVAREAARVALLKLDAREAPSGPMPVVMKRGAGGVLFHEACGHGLEADLIAKEASVFAHRIGEQVASPLVSLIDDGTLTGEWGAFAIDDEGHASQSNTLIENGMLTDYMWDYLRAKKEGRVPSGNGRRQSYQHLPMVRMTNTFLRTGTSTHDDIIADTPQGIYVAGLGGGSVNTATGDFVFSMTEAYLIEDGRITAPLRDAMLIGNGPEVLKNIDAVADDFAFGWGGTCGKNGQGVFVGQGQPTLRVPKGLSIGGTAA